MQLSIHEMWALKLRTGIEHDWFLVCSISVYWLIVCIGPEGYSWRVPANPGRMAEKAIDRNINDFVEFCEEDKGKQKDWIKNWIEKKTIKL